MQSVRLKCLRKTDLVGPLRAYISVHFSANESSDLDPALNDIQMIRDQVISYIHTPTLDYERALHAHEEYLAALGGLISRFPFGEIESPSLFKKKEITAVMVQWYATDAFKPEKSAISYDVSFEQSVICFNIAAIHSRQALALDRESPNGIQSACKSLLRASGIFQSMAATMSRTVPNSVDLSSGGLSFLSNLMLAQAAALSFDSAVRKPMAPAVLGVLASGVCDAYIQTRTALRSQPDLSKWLNKSDFVDEKFLTYQIGCFESASHYWQSEKDQIDSQYGVVIARLKLSLSLLHSVAKCEPVNESCRNSRKKLEDIVANKLKSAVYDNDTIYHYPVPTDAELSIISPKLVVKPTPFTMPLSKLPRAFDGLVSVEIQKAIQQFKSEMSDEVTVLTNTCLDSSDICRSALSEMNLPAALDALDADSRIPQDIIAKLNDVRNSGGVAALKSLQKEIQEMSSNTFTLRNEISQMLSQEQGNEDRLRNQYQQTWDRTPSSEINSSYFRDLNNITKYLEQGKDADSKIAIFFTQSFEVLTYISKPIADIESTLPVLDKSAKSESSEKVRTVLCELSSLLRKRDRLLNDFEKDVESFDPTPTVLAKKNASTVEQILQKEKAYFESHRKAIDENLAKQSLLFDTLVDANQRFVQSHKVSDVEDRRQKCLQNINEGIAAFEKIHRNLVEGLSFYTDLLNEYLKPLKDNALGFITARDHEARLLLDDISRSFGQVSVSDRGSLDRRFHPDGTANEKLQNPSAPPRF